METVAYFSNPKLADAVVQEIRQAFDTELEWLDQSYPIAMSGEASGEIFPIVFVSKDQIVDVRPDSSVDAYCFFEVRNVIIGNEDDPNEYNLSVIFWINLDRVDQNASQDYTWNTIADVIGVLQSNDCQDIEVDVENPFSRYTFAMNMGQTIRHYSAFKLDFTTYGLNTTCEI